jgi:formylmethanofuran dehydrogenase subunit C
MIVLTPLRKFKFPVIAECINPDVFQGKTLQEITTLTLFEGNKQKKLGDLFKVKEVKAESPHITINGDVSEVRRIGRGMKDGDIVINGNAGMHLGSKMTGGMITVHGDVSGWAGAEMRGGVIEIYGDAGDYLASPYRGSTEGMRKGKIIVHGNVGSDVAVFMHSGTIKIYGNTKQFLGFRMRGGTIYVEKNADTRVGACMTGGKIVVSGFLEEVLPTFTIDRVKPKVKIEEAEKVSGPFYVFLGDLAEKGNGKLFVSKENNPHLSQYEKFL